MNSRVRGVAAITTLQDGLQLKQNTVKLSQQKLKPQKSKSQLSGYLHAMVMLFCFAILLGTTYTEQQPYVYSSSHQALMNAVKRVEALQVTTIDELWDWVNSVVGSIGGKGIDSVNGNCQYSPYNSQDVTIDGVTYTLEDPSLDYSACFLGNMDFVTGSNYEVYLTGNHQMLSFGIFTLRSVPQYPVRKSVKNAHESVLKVRSSEIAPLDPLKDDKVIEICEVNWGHCVLRDGYKGEAGSTLNWDGRIVDGYYAFGEASTSYMILTPAVTEPIAVQPCYMYSVVSPTMPPTMMPTFSGTSPGTAAGTSSDTSSGTSDSSPPPPVRSRYLSDVDSDGLVYVARPGNPTWNGNISQVVVSNCEYTWVSSGYDLRVACLNQHNIQPTPLLAYLARKQNYDTVNELMDSYFGCNSLFTATSQTMDHLYVNGNKCLESNILGNLAYGVFFSCENQDFWIRESNEGLLQLQAHNYIDENTRLVRIYFITRSLGREQLFYSVITVEFALGTDGSISGSVTATYVPMIMFQYGYDGFEWRGKDTYRFEIMLMILFALFTLREIYQLFTKRFILFLPVSWREKWVKKDKSNNNNKGVEKVKPVGEAAAPVFKRGRSAIVPVVQNPNYPSGSPGRQRSSDGVISVAVQRIQEKDEQLEGMEGGLSQEKQYSSPPHRGDLSLVDINSAHSLEEKKATSLTHIDPHEMNGGQSSSSSLSPSKQSQDNSFITKKPSELLTKKESNEIGQMVEEMEEMVEEFEDVIEDILDDYTPDSDGVHDMLDWATIAVITIGIFYRIHYIHSAASLHNFLMELEANREYDIHMEQIVAKFANMQSQDETIHLIAIAVIAVGMLQFFRYLSFNKRFGIVTNTIAASTSDLLPVLIIFVSIVIAYAILASEIYGIQMEEYSTVQTSLAALFIMLLGNFDYYAMQDVSPVETAIFFWSFVVVILFILLNMVLAVIFTVYDEKNREIREKEAEEAEKERAKQAN